MSRLVSVWEGVIKYQKIVSFSPREEQCGAWRRGAKCSEVNRPREQMMRSVPALVETSLERSCKGRLIFP